MTDACDACLRRSWLVARLAGRIELARHERRRLREILALSDDELLDGVAGEARTSVAAELEELEPDALREASAAAELETVCRHGDAYPARLRDLVDPPASLWIAGSCRRLAELAGGDLEEGPRAVAVVGTRQASPDGAEVARALGRGLAVTGVTVVSGMALGIDAAAHAGALEGGGRTVAVMAGGADVPYPRRKAPLHREIGRAGCVVSEMPPGTGPFRWGFPARNRTTPPYETPANARVPRVVVTIRGDVSATRGIVRGAMTRSPGALVWSDPEPARQLRRHLAAAREHGEPFTDAWPHAVQAALRHAPASREKTDWRLALDATRAGWEHAYHDRPALPACGALSRLTRRRVSTTERHGDAPTDATASHPPPSRTAASKRSRNATARHPSRSATSATPTPSAGPSASPSPSAPPS